jgi:hypothetical protein
MGKWSYPMVHGPFRSIFFGSGELYRSIGQVRIDTVCSVAGAMLFLSIFWIIVTFGSMDRERVVITGVGLAAPNANNLADFRHCLLDRISRVQEMEVR